MLASSRSLLSPQPGRCIEMPDSHRKMLPPDAASHYAGMNKVLAYIDNNLKDDLSLNTLARVSGYSEYHFHRIFHALTGKTLHEYVCDRRIIAAAARLLYERNSVTRIAFDCGFSSSSSFGRCFKQQLGCSPSAYRRNKGRKRPLNPTDSAVLQIVPNQEMESLFCLATLPDLRVAGITTQGLSKTFSSSAIEQAFKRLFAWLARNQLITANMRVMGITLDTPEVVSLAECRYFACVPADEHVKPEGEISVRTFPSKGRYITFSLDRARPDFADVFFGMTDYLYGCYMPNRGWFPDNRPFVEVYSQAGPTVQICFHVPVTR
ncbi:MAG: AraC family transcriptional regulator [Clostridiales bacterium]|nr:AraC family transcriptional regulator [Clostridiales bacterium]